MTRATWGLYLTVAAIWGLPYALISVALDHGAGPGLVAWARVAMGAVVLLGLAAARGSLGAIRGNVLVLTGVAASDIAVPFTALSVGEQHVSSSLASILVATTPLFVGLLAAAFVPSERSTRRGWGGLGLGFGGVVVLFGHGLGGDAASAALMLVAGASYAVASLLVRTRLADVPPLASGAWALALAAVMLSPGPFIEGTSHPDAGAWAAIAALGAVCTATAFALYYELIARAGASRAALTTYVSPLFSIAVGALALSETVAVNALVGLVLILGGSWLAT